VIVKSVSYQRHDPSLEEIFMIRIASFTDTITPYLQRHLLDEIIRAIATKYVEVHGDEVLRRINEQTIDAKVIQKVVSNLRKELEKGGSGE
jgi:hypothetical protein